MRYYLLRVLTYIKKLLGLLTTLIAKGYNKLSITIANGLAKEEARIARLRDTVVTKAKTDVVIAAQRVIELEQNVQAVEIKADKKAQDQLFKLKTKVQ